MLLNSSASAGSVTRTATVCRLGASLFGAVVPIGVPTGSTSPAAVRAPLGLPPAESLALPVGAVVQPVRPLGQSASKPAARIPAARTRPEGAPGRRATVASDAGWSMSRLSAVRSTLVSTKSRGTPRSQGIDLRKSRDRQSLRRFLRVQPPLRAWPFLTQCAVLRPASLFLSFLVEDNFPTRLTRSGGFSLWIPIPDVGSEGPSPSFPRGFPSSSLETSDAAHLPRGVLCWPCSR